jgi:hypothetical protein
MVIRRIGPAAALAAAGVLAMANSVFANVALTQISSDRFSNTTAVDGAAVYHATEEEPDTFAYGSTIVAAFQVGRFHNGGADDIGVAVSTNGGQTWKHQLLPGLTFQVDPSSPYERVSDASVAYDARDDVWMVSSIPITASGVVPTVFVSRSTDGGRTWNAPVSIPPTTGPVNLDKNWTVCDNTATSPHYGNCYTELDNFAVFDLEELSTSTDGGATWSVPISTPTHAHGLGGQPLVQPDGTVVVPFEGIDGLATISSFSSTDGGATLTNAVTIATIDFHSVAGDLRTSPLPSAEIDGAGKVFVGWEDCRFEPGCAANDIVFSTSGNGQSWTAPARIPIDPVGSGVDHFIPGLGVDRSTSGGSAHIGLTYYYYPVANCTVSTCQLDAGFISSSDGGATWGGREQLAGAMNLTWLAFTTQGYMVGDYIATSFSGGLAYPVISVASFGTPTQNLNQAMFVTTSGQAVFTGTGTASTAAGAKAGTSTLSFVVGPTTR